MGKHLTSVCCPPVRQTVTDYERLRGSPDPAPSHTFTTKTIYCPALACRSASHNLTCWSLGIALP